MVVQHSLPDTIAICGIEGGVAKAKLASIPMIQITEGIFNDVVILPRIEAATVATRVAVTIFEDTFVCKPAHKAKIINKTKSGKTDNEELKLVCKNNFNPIESFVRAKPNANVPAHIIKLVHGMPFLNASLRSKRGFLSIRIIHNNKQPKIGGIAVPYLLKNV